MASYIGVHIGNSSACVVVGKNGKASVVANSHGDRLTPSMVTFTGDETLVGFSSKQVCHRYISETVKHFIAHVGKSLLAFPSEVESMRSSTLGPILQRSPDEKLVYSINENGKNVSYTPGYILELLLHNLLETAISQAGSEVKEAVFTAPVGFSNAYRDAVVNAATNAGFEVLRIISEPAAAALAYGIGVEKIKPPVYDILVYRVGGVSQDVTLLTINDGILSIKKNISKRSGGDSLTEIVAQHFATLFHKQYRTDITSNAKSMNKLRIHAEKCKHVLSSMPSANCHIDSLYDGLDFSCNISRSMFEMLAKNHLQTLVRPLEEIMSELSDSMIKKVVLCGGTCCIPKLQQLVSETLPDAEILSTILPSEVSAIGAATEAGILIGQDCCDVSEEDCLVAVAPVDIYLKVDEERHIIVPQRTILPFNLKQQCKIPNAKSHIEVCLAVDGCQIGGESGDIILGSLPYESNNSDDFSYELKYHKNGSMSFSCGDPPKCITINAAA